MVPSGGMILGTSLNLTRASCWGLRLGLFCPFGVTEMPLSLPSPPPSPYLLPLAFIVAALSFIIRISVRLANSRSPGFVKEAVCGLISSWCRAACQFCSCIAVSKAFSLCINKSPRDASEPLRSKSIAVPNVTASRWLPCRFSAASRDFSSPVSRCLPSPGRGLLKIRLL